MYRSTGRNKRGSLSSIKTAFVISALFLAQRALSKSEGCCGGGGSGSVAISGLSPSGKRAFPTLNQQVGGSDGSGSIRLTHTGPQKIIVTYNGSSAELEGDVTKYLKPNHGGEGQPLPGETSKVASETEDDNGAGPQEGALAVEGLAQPCRVSLYELLPPLEETLPDGGEGDTPTTLHPYNRGGGGANDGAGMPPPSTPSSANEPPGRDQTDIRPTEKHGTALQTDPGGTKPGSAGGAVDVAPNIMVAAGLGKSHNDNGCAGYLVPNPQRGPGVGPEQIGYYTARISNSITSYVHSATDLRWVAPDGLTILRQKSPTKVAIQVYAVADFEDFEPKPTKLPRRTTTVEKLTTGSPAAHYTTGYQMRRAVTGKPTAVTTTWASGVTQVGVNFCVYSYIKNEMDGLAGIFSRSESISTRFGTSIDRTIDITTTEAIAQPAVAGATTTSTMVHKSQEKRRLFAWGEETIESTTYLTPSTSGASRTEYYDWYEVPQNDPNYARVRLHHRTDGQWEAYFAGVDDTTVTGAKLAGTLRGWKDKAAPTVTTAGELAALIDDVGYAGSVMSKKWGQNPLREEEWANGNLVAKSEDLTPIPQPDPMLPPNRPVLRTTTKRYAGSGASDFYVTVKTRSANGYPQHTFELERGKMPSDLYADPDPGDCIRWRYEAHSESGSGGVINSTVVKDAAHLPTRGYVVQRNATTGLTQEIQHILVEAVIGGYPTVTTLLSGERWEYAEDGRTLFKKDWQYNILEAWLYPAADKIEHRDASGITRRYEYDIQGRLLRETILTVGSQSIADMPNSPGLLGQNYYNVIEWYRAAPTELGTVSKTTKRLSAKTIVDGAPYNLFSRSWVEYIDGLGRTVVESDPLNTRKETAYDHSTSGTLVTTKLPVTPVQKLQEVKYYLSGQLKSVVFPGIAGTGGAGIDRYYDYVTGTYSQTTMSSHYDTFTTTNGYEATTVNGVGLTIATEAPSGMNGSALNMHTTTIEYDDEKRVKSVMEPIAQAAGTGNLYSVNHYVRKAPNSSEVDMHSARSVDDDWHAEDANQSVTKTAMISDVDINGGKWSVVRKVWDGTEASGVPREATYEQLEVDSVTETTSLGAWILTRAATHVQHGATLRSTEFLLPGTALTRTRSYVDGQLRLSITFHNGLDRLYDTNGTTYTSKVATFNAIRERESEVSDSSGYWPKTTYSPATGLPYMRMMPDATTQYYYEWYQGDDFRAGRMKSMWDYGKSGFTYYDYNARGQLTRKWGPAESPSQMLYDSQGRMTHLHTWRSGTWTGATWPTSPPAADITEWKYPPSLALNVAKIYPDLGGQNEARRTVTYTYWPNGAVKQRTWQRKPEDYSITAGGLGVQTGYEYDEWSRLQKIEYPAATTTVAATPDVTFTYNPAGQVKTRTEAGQTSTTYEYTAWGQPSKETVSSLANGFPPSEVARSFDTSNRIDLLKVKSGTTVAPDVDYGFHSTTGLLETVVADGRTVTYGYAVLGSTPTGTPRSRTYAHGLNTLLQTDMPRNARGLIDGISHRQGSVPVLYQSMTYAYNVDKVTSITHGHEANMFWSMGYDSRGQVTSADKKFATGGEFAAGLQTQYTYDTAGNRLTKAQGGSATTAEGTGVRTTDYGTANAVNQYVTIDHPDDGTSANPNDGTTTWLPITGLRGASNETIKVNTIPAGYQQGTNGLGFHREVPLSPSTLANRYFNITVTKTVSGTTTTIDSGIQYVPPDSETLLYDADGNLRQDHRFTYLYDAENRLAKVSLVNPTVSSPSLSYNYTYTYYYDGLSRLVAKRTDMNFNPSTPYWIYMEAFVYDGWNLVMSGKSGNGYTSGPPANPITSSSRMHYVWGPDIGSGCSGHDSWQAAGGVGGLIFVNGATNSVRQFPLIDRMGNVTGYRRADSSSAAVLDAVFEYDAFGRELRSTGPASNTMAFRYSTKATDVDTGLVYYGYRFYDPDRGRWINRDPIGELGGNNIYCFVENSATNFLDVSGLQILGPDGHPARTGPPPGGPVLGPDGLPARPSPPPAPTPPTPPVPNPPTPPGPAPKPPKGDPFRRVLPCLIALETAKRAQEDYARTCKAGRYPSLRACTMCCNKAAVMKILLAGADVACTRGLLTPWAIKDIYNAVEIEQRECIDGCQDNCNVRDLY